MVKAIENWVKSRIGIFLTLDSPKISEQLYDGNVYYHILKSYNIINNECLVEPPKHCSTNEALVNLLRLIPWFQLIGISEPRIVFKQIAQKDRAKCIWLLFELFVLLEEKSVIALLTKQKTKQDDIVNLNKKQLPQQTTVELTMKYKSLKERIIHDCKEEAQKKRDLIKNKSIIYDNKLCKSSVDMIKQNTLSSLDISYSSPQKRLQKGKIPDEILKLKISNAFLHEMWASVAQKKEKEFQSLLIRKLDEHRIYEQNLATRLAKNHNHFKEYFIRCSKAENLNGDSYLIKNETLRNKGIEMTEINKSILMLHECLYKEKLQLKYLNRIKLAQDIIFDLVDMAIVTSEYNNQNGIPPTKAIINDWKELFYKGIPFFLNNQRPSTLSEESELEYDFEDVGNMSYEDIRTIDTQLLRDRVISKTLVEFYVHSYLYLVDQWAIEQWAELRNGYERLNTLGFVIHRLLECKYPFPQPPEPVKIENLKIRSVIKYFVEPFIFCLQELLKQSDVVLIKFNDALQYCINIYENELEIITIERRKYNKNDFKIKDSEIPLIETNLQLKSKKCGKKIEQIDKSVQYPQTRDIFHHVRHSTTGNIGKLAKELINKDFPIDDILRTKIVVEYIKSLKTYSGFVLTDFPNNVSQAVLLEFLITGRPIETKIKLNKEVNSFILNEINSPVTADTRRILDFDLLFSDELRETTLEVIPTFYDITKAKKLRQNELLDEPTLLEEEKTGKADANFKKVYSAVEENSDSSPTKYYKSDFKTENETDSRVKNKTSANETANVKSETTKMVPTKKKQRSFAGNVKSTQSKSKKTVQTTKSNIQTDLYNELDIEEEPVVIDPYINVISSQELVKLRTSKILPRPNSGKTNQPNLETFFKSCVADLSELNLDNDDSWKKLKLSPPLNFYKSLNILFSVGLGGSHVNAKEVARLIMREPTEEGNPWRKKSEELFGKTALNICSNIKINKIAKDSLSSHRASIINKKSRTDLKNKIKFSSKDKISKDESIKEKLVDEDLKIAIEHTPVIPNPGDKGWNYMEEPLSEEVQISLASHWEIVEYVYLQSVYHVMNLLHVHGAKFFPFRNFIRNLMDEDIDVNDSRQQIVSNFQVLFNDVSDECRNNMEMKCELHCKVHELWNLLCELADKNKRLLENQLKQIMEQGRIIDYCFTLSNIYLSLMQIEIDRYVDTVHILNEYYLCMLKEEPQRTKPLIKLEKVQLQRIIIPSKDDNKSIQDRDGIRNTSIKSSSSMSQIKQINDEIFLNGKLVLKNIIDLVIPAIQEAAKISSHSLNTVKAFVNDYNIGETLKTQLRKKRGHDLWVKTTKRKYELAPNLQVALQLCDSTKSPSFRRNEIQPPYIKEMNFKDMDRVDKIKWEWYTSVEDEGDRMQFRIKLIETKMNDELDEIFNLATTLYNHYVTDIVVRYYQEKRAIDQLCKVLKAAVDGGYSIRPKLILEKDKFYMDSINLLYPDIAPPPPTPLELLSKEFRFNMSQIDRFASKMEYVAPQGILGATFVLILEDMVTYTSQDHHPYLPVNWRFLNKKDIEFILEQAFGKRIIYDWRDFIIFNMNLTLPDLNHLLDLKHQYKSFDKLENETITYNNYITIPLWFESIPCDVDDIELAKNIIFKLFQVNKSEMNYSAMLFAFCKDEDSIEGFMKALILADRKDVLIDAQTYKYKLDNKNENEEISHQIINQLIYDVLSKTEGFTITTLRVENSFEFIETENDVYLEEMEEENVTSSCTTIGIHPEITPNPTYPERYFHPKWHVCIPNQTVLKVLLTASNLQENSNNFVTREELENAIRSLYHEEGKNEHIQTYKLAQSKFLNEFFDSTGLFKSCNMSYYVQQYLKSGSLTDRNTSSL